MVTVAMNPDKWKDKQKQLSDKYKVKVTGNNGQIDQDTPLGRVILQYSYDGIDARVSVLKHPPLMQDRIEHEVQQFLEAA